MTLLEPTHDFVRLQSNGYNSPWTGERVDLLKLRWSEGATCREIAEEMGLPRNAVIGKVHRLDLETRSTAPRTPRFANPTPRIREPRQPRPKTRFITQRRPDSFHRSPIGRPVAPSLPADPDAPSPHACALVELDDTKCHFPIGHPDKPGFHFCGGTAAHERGPYCDGHYRIAYR